MDFNFEDVEEIFREDRYFEYIRRDYDVGEKEEEVFNVLKEYEGDGRRTSLEVLTVKKEGFYPRVFLEDHEDQRMFIRTYEVDEISLFPVDMNYSREKRKSLILITILILEYTYYSRMEKIQ